MFIIVVIFIAVIYYYVTRNFNYWSKRNVKHDRPIPLFGNHFRNVFCIKSITDISCEHYFKYPNEKVVGYYRGNTPELIIRDLEIARHILNVDFYHFYPRGLGRDTKVEPLLANLFHADDDTWKLLRQRLTPAFTTAKLKAMFPLIINCADKLQVMCENIVAKGGECEVRDVMARFTTEFIAACGFGMDTDVINDEHSFLRIFGKRIFSRSLRDVVAIGIWETFPIFRKFIKVTETDVENFFYNLMTQIFADRNNKPIGRNDFIDQLLELQTKGKIVGESLKNTNPDGTPAQTHLEFDFKLMVAQVFIFFAAGFETSSSATSFTLHQLAFHPEIQEKIQEQIDEVLSNYDNKLCYESVSQLTLLDWAFKESLRMFPSLGVLNRECAKQYTIPELGITIDPGVKILIPIQAIQNDEKYFDKPEVFNPERFSPETTRPNYCYMPFGKGPRACIGERLGQMQSITGLAAILHKFTVVPASATRQKVLVDAKMNVVQSVKGLPLKLMPRKNKIT